MRVIVLYFFSFVFVSSLFAQQIHQEEIQEEMVLPENFVAPFNNKKAVIEEGQLKLSFDFVCEEGLIGGYEGLLLCPVYKVGENAIKLPFVLINGKSRDRYYERKMTFLPHEEYILNKPLIRTVYDRKKQQVINYRITYALPEKMPENGVLVVEQYLQRCCDSKFVAAEPFILNQEPVVTQPIIGESVPSKLLLDLYDVAFVKPEKEIRKERAQSLSLLIKFMVNSHNIIPHYSDNSAELSKVDSLLAPFNQKREFYTLEQVSIRGYASPEGSYEHNMTLSQRRADSFKKYLISTYQLHDLETFPAIGMGEDWEGLRKAIEGNTIPRKEEVLRIIDEVDLFKGREKQLMDLDGGVPYRHMLKNLYPSLRRMEMQVSYIVNAFDLGQARDMIKTRPQDLSHEEIFSIAQENNRSIIDRELFGEEYILAAKIFPQDVLANINAASVWLIRGDFEKAGKCLEKVGNDNRAYNNIALYYWGTGDYVQAERFFVKAVEMGVDKKQALRNYKKFKLSVR